MFGNKNLLRLMLVSTVFSVVTAFSTCVDGEDAAPLTDSALTTRRDNRLDSVDFERHVAPMLGRHGCNSAACHGAFGGKGGLQLSLFGYSAKLDYQSLRDYIDTDDPESSLMLRKPTELEDHEGGRRFNVDSETYRTIHRWIASGANWKQGSGDVARLIVKPTEVIFQSDDNKTPRSPQLSVVAEFNDGSSEDVTSLCHYTSGNEGVATVSADGSISREGMGDASVIISYRNEFAEVNVLSPFDNDFQPTAIDGLSTIDFHIIEKLNKLKISPSTPADDTEFLRRVTLDTIGTLPSPDEIERFCHDNATDKRERIIDSLLDHPMHAALWATRMCDITKCDVGQMGEDDKMQTRRAQMWHDWFRKQFEDNEPYSEIVRRIVTATSRGPLEMNDWVDQEANLIRRSRESFDNSYADREFFDLYWRRLGEDGKLPLKETAELTAVAFTGVRLNCAQCHKHPFDRWTQDDYAAFTNIFAGVIFGNSTKLNVAITAELERRREAKRKGEKRAALPQLREVFNSDRLSHKISGSDPNAVVDPRPLGYASFAAERDSRQQFYEWLIDDRNPYFARNFANRVWAVYFGIGLVDPVDDFSISNPASHPQLLNDLAKMFRESKFDIRELEKQILLSNAYQRSSTPNDSNRTDRRNFARQYVRPLMAEVVFDCINKVLGTTDSFDDDARVNSLAIEVGANNLKSRPGRTLKILGRGERETICDCSRRTENDLRQYIFMINDTSIHQKIKNGAINQLKSLAENELVNQLYLRILARYPTDAEREIGVAHFEELQNHDTAFEDLIWALLNSREFTTNH